jgi:hypothetical protein
MRGTVLYGPRDVRSEERPEPTIVEPTDAMISGPTRRAGVRVPFWL